MKKTMLVAESCDLVARIVFELATRYGYEVIDTVSSGEQALAAVAPRRPDLALIDLHIGGEVTGVEVARRLIADGVGVAFMSGLPTDRSRALAASVGTHGFITKPFGVTEFRQGLESLLDQSRTTHIA